MDSTTSLSKGCFAFGPKSKKRKKCSDEVDEFEDLYLNPQVKVYSKLIKDIEKRLNKINNSASDEVLQDTVQFVSGCPQADFAVPTAVLLTGVNLPDHQVLFQSLAEKLKESVTEHVSVLMSSECTTVKSTIEQLTSQFIRRSTASLENEMDVDSDEEENPFDDVKMSQCTMPNLASWYKEQTSNKSIESSNQSSLAGKLVVIIPDFEGFSSKVLQDVILILSSYLERLPLVLVIGVATSVKALQSSLPHRVTARMDVRMFQSQPSVHFLNRTVNEIFLSFKKNPCPFLLGPKIFKFLTDVFIFYDFSVHGFIQGIKYCLMEHFFNNPLSKLCCSKKKLADTVLELSKEDLKTVGESKHFRAYIEKLPKPILGKILRDDKYFKETVLNLMKDLQKHKEQLITTLWLLHALVHDLPEAPMGKQLREIYVEVMSRPLAEHPKFDRCFQVLNLTSKQELLQKIDDMCTILSESPLLIEEQAKLMELRHSVDTAGQNTKGPSVSPSKFMISPCKDRRQLQDKLLSKSTRVQNEFEQARSKVLDWLKRNLFEKYLVSPSSLPLHEVILIDNMSVKRHIVGAPRAALHVALNNPHHYLQCDCCKMSHEGEIKATMPDICIAYKLHLESGALINMYDWLQSFVTILSPDDCDREETNVDPELQARFTRAVSELQLMGFVKGSRKKTDHVARLTWGGSC